MADDSSTAMQPYGARTTAMQCDGFSGGQWPYPMHQVATRPHAGPPVSYTVERSTMQYSGAADAAAQLATMQRHVVHLEEQLSDQSHLAQRYIAEQRDDLAGRAHAVLLEQRQEFETQASAYQGLAREVASAELEHQRQELDYSHRESIAQISCHVHIEEAEATRMLIDVNQKLDHTIATANGAEAQAEQFWRANQTLETELEGSRAAVASPYTLGRHGLTQSSVLDYLRGAKRTALPRHTVYITFAERGEPRCPPPPNQSLSQQALAHDRLRMEEIASETSQRDFYLRKTKENQDALDSLERIYQQRERELCDDMAQLRVQIKQKNSSVPVSTVPMPTGTAPVPVSTVPTHTNDHIHAEIAKLKQQLQEKEADEEIRRLETVNISTPRRVVWPDVQNSPTRQSWATMSEGSGSESSAESSEEKEQPNKKNQGGLKRQTPSVLPTYLRLRNSEPGGRNSRKKSQEHQANQN